VNASLGLRQRSAAVATPAFPTDATSPPRQSVKPNFRSFNLNMLDYQ
jgi:hypothetical protein